MSINKLEKKHNLIIAGILVFYFLITLFNLSKLPVFADEAIYIRWTQLIIDDWQRYLFFPMNDGKTPLQMWLMLPLQFVFHDQLFAGRFLSVIIGTANILLIGLIAKLMTRNEKNQKLSQYLAMFLTSILPFTFFHHRMALTDALLFLNLNLSFFFALKYVLKKKNFYLLLLIISFFLALFSKLSALLFILSLLVLIFYQKKFSYKKLIKNLLFLSSTLAFAFVLFYSLRYIPVFPQLFRRGGDFLHPFQILWSSELLNVIKSNLLFFSEQFIVYFGYIVLILALVIFDKDNKQAQFILILAFLAFISPLACLGKIIYPRYLLPTSLFLIVAASLSLSSLLKNNKQVIKFISFALLLLISLHSFNFIYPSYFNINTIPFTKADRSQYLEEWSSGQGIREISQLLLQTSQKQSLAVATEGYFGTLPDGILMYLHRQNVNNLMVEGIGQPIASISDNFLNKAKDYKSLWLVVNSYRLKMPINKELLIKEYCRPNNAPCLQMWDVSYLLENHQLD